MTYTEAQIKAIVVTPICSGVTSFVASGTLIFMILRSELKLTVPSRRIFFGMCVYDCFQSLSSAFSTLPIPKGQGMGGSMGNIGSCDAQGKCLHLLTRGVLRLNFSSTYQESSVWLPLTPFVLSYRTVIASFYTWAPSVPSITTAP